MLDIDKLVERAAELYKLPAFSLWAEEWLEGTDRTEQTAWQIQRYVLSIKNDPIGGMYWTLDAAFNVAKASRLRRVKPTPEETADAVRKRLQIAADLEEQALRSATVAARLTGG